MGLVDEMGVEYYGLFSYYDSSLIGFDRKNYKFSFRVGIFATD